MERKIIQICCSECEEDSNFFALADDGTLWNREYIYSDKKFTWKQIENIPQPENPNKDKF